MYVLISGGSKQYSFVLLPLMKTIAIGLHISWFDKVYGIA